MVSTPPRLNAGRISFRFFKNRSESGAWLLSSNASMPPKPCICFLAVAPAAAQDAEPEAGPGAEAVGGADDAVDPDSGEANLEAYWRRRLDRAAQRRAQAREKAVEAEAAYSRARHDSNPR